MSARKQKIHQKRRSRERYLRGLQTLIRTGNDPILSQKCEPVDTASDWGAMASKLRSVLATSEGGVGLAAPQIGWALRAFSMQVDKRKDPRVFINPEIIEFSPEKLMMIEGCLSYPGVSVIVQRSKTVTVKYLTINLVEKTETFKGLEARIVQHECDHLDGICKVRDGQDKGDTGMAEAVQGGQSQEARPD